MTEHNKTTARILIVDDQEGNIRLLVNVDREVQRLGRSDVREVQRLGRSDVPIEKCSAFVNPLP